MVIAFFVYYVCMYVGPVCVFFVYTLHLFLAYCTYILCLRIIITFPSSSLRLYSSLLWWNFGELPFVFEVNCSEMFVAVCYMQTFLPLILCCVWYRHSRAVLKLQRQKTATGKAEFLG